MNALANCASVATRGNPVKDASRRKGGGLRPSLTAAPRAVIGFSGQDEETTPFSRTKKHHWLGCHGFSSH